MALLGRTLFLVACFVGGLALARFLSVQWPGGPWPVLGALGLVAGGAGAGLVPWLAGQAPRGEAILRTAWIGGATCAASLGCVVVAGRAETALRLLEPAALFGEFGLRATVVLASGLGMACGAVLLAYSVFTAGMWGSGALLGWAGRRLRASRRGEP